MMRKLLSSLPEDMQVKEFSCGCSAIRLASEALWLTARNPKRTLAQ